MTVLIESSLKRKLEKIRKFKSKVDDSFLIIDPKKV